jgi:hypothetical protein
MRKLTHAVFILFLLTFTTAAQAVSKPENPETDAVMSDEDQARKVILEAVFGQQSATYLPLEVYYVAVDDKKDPSELLLKSISGMRLHIAKASRSFIARSSAVVDRKTKKHGVLVTISKLVWKNKDEVEAAGGTYEGNMASFSCRYTAKRENGVWKISGAAQCMIS